MIALPRIAAFQLSLRAALAAGLSTARAQLLRLPFPIYAMISAVIVTDLDPSRTRKSGLPRLAGTVLGATPGASMGAVLQPGAWEVGAGILAVMLCSHLMRLPDAAKLAGYVSGIVLLDHGDHPWFYALNQTMETALGIGVAVLVRLAPKLIPTDDNRNT
jgi:uncharacterized membrane protein YgaE (UPF0421/DUF939 family)